ncbi:helix-turn-helix domain-containing protein [Streptomyces ipomoeae]|jgi:transcriptional regulator with XRE-family HTH domain|uniref:helix-turn-helix domain-containing protein n=1 Tax=Streptomyces ipomoeae TaxID=103232 RepID=UPI00114757CC|nr:helix-turn-helix transcriptional regulator [Streptomyces ipomoeae]MDX2935131.1 helix-turn-helix transcriptional regulator [Streptomyces ipomoeae]TQE19146.1 XRE family transcriptional regulator [Streptomyces ipomoeae]
MSRDTDPSLNRRRLRIELRKAREDAGLTQREAADALEWSLSKVIRLEAATVSLSVTDLRALLQLYNVTEPGLVAELEDAARGSKGLSWWAPYSDMVHPQFAQYLGYESATTSLRTYHPTLIPALFQTEDYAMAQLAPRSAPEVARRSAELRTTRQERIFDGEKGPEVHIVLDEAAVRRVIGGPGVMRHQLEHLKNMSEHSRVTMRLFPFTAGAHYSVAGSFTLLGFKDDDDLLFLEGPTGISSSRDELELTARYQECFEDISSKAYEGDRMIELIDTVKESLDNS